MTIKRGKVPISIRNKDCRLYVNKCLYLLIRMNTALSLELGVFVRLQNSFDKE